MADFGYIEILQGREMMSQAECPQKAPYKTEVKAGKKYFWCSCGKSENQPFCDGKHKDSGFEPVIYEAAKDGEVYFCGCHCRR